MSGNSTHPNFLLLSRLAPEEDLKSFDFVVAFVGAVIALRVLIAPKFWTMLVVHGTALTS